MAIDVEATFEKVNDEFLQFDRIESPPCKRPDLCAFLKLDELVPGDRDLVAAAAHDQIYLGVTKKALAEVSTEDDVIYLARCGVFFERDSDSLSMFV